MEYRLLYDIPRGSDRDRALREYSRFLRTEGFQRFGRLQWISHVRALSDRFKNGEDRHWVINALNESGDPVMAAYAQTELTLGAKER